MQVGLNGERDAAALRFEGRRIDAIGADKLGNGTGGVPSLWARDRGRNASEESFSQERVSSLELKESGTG